MRDLRADDWPEVARIYAEGIETGNATFETEVPSWEAWDASHLPERTGSSPSATGGSSAGSRSLPVSSRECYSGVAEVSVVRARGSARRRASAARCSTTAIDGAERGGIWTLQTSVFPENAREPARCYERFGFREVGTRERIGAAARHLARHGSGRTAKRGDLMTKVEAVVLRERVEIVIDAVEEQTGHVGVTVVEAVGHGRERGITHEYRGRVFESRFLPKALLTFIVEDALAEAVAERDRRRGPLRQRLRRRARLDDPRRARHAQPHRAAARGGRA